MHDPFAGTGRRLGKLCDALGLRFTGTEIEAEFIVDPRVAPGNAINPDTYPRGPFCVVTSPAYPNGMADHFAARDGSRRHTYRQALAAIRGHDRELSSSNMGRYSIRRGRRAETEHFAIAGIAMHRWPPDVIVNVSDFIAAGERYPLVDRWRRLLGRHGYTVTDVVEVPTPRQRHGAHAELRVEAEARHHGPPLNVSNGAPPRPRALPNGSVWHRCACATLGGVCDTHTPWHRPEVGGSPPPIDPGPLRAGRSSLERPPRLTPRYRRAP